MGICSALWLSVKLLGLDEKVLLDYEKQLPILLSETEIILSEADVDTILSYLVYDKKNKGEKNQFVLLKAIGEPIWDVEVEPSLVHEALGYVITKVSKR